MCERSRKSVARKNLVEERGPWAYERGQREGTAAWRAFREACSPGGVCKSTFG